MHSGFRKAVFTALQCTWGIIQNAVGAAVYLLLKDRPHEHFHGSVITYVKKRGFGGISLGVFIFINADSPESWLHDVRLHEYGHTVQSALLGPLWLFVIALPSALWANMPALRRRRERTGRSYYSLYCESWANAAGRRACGEDFCTDSFKNHCGRVSKRKKGCAECKVQTYTQD